MRRFKNQSLERALQIICAFTFESRKLTLTEMSSKLGIPLSTTYRLVLTLVDYGFVEFDDVTRQYSLGLKLMEIGSIVYSSFSLRQIASPALNELLTKMGSKNVCLAIFRNDEIIYIDKKEDPRNPIKFATTEVGRHRPPFFGMFGLLFMAFMSEEEVERLLMKTPLTAFTSKSIVNVDEFKAALSKVRENGHSLDDGGAFEGFAGIASPVWHSGKPVAAVGVSFITALVSNEEQQYVVESVKEASRKISEQLPKVMPSMISS